MAHDWSELSVAIRLIVIEEVKLITTGVVTTIGRFLEENVDGFHRLGEAECSIYARLLAGLLVDGQCGCGHASCDRSHTIQRWNAQRFSLRSFVSRAIRGPLGLQANSVQQGMLFPYLQRDYGLHVVKVAFRQCQNEDCTYRISQLEHKKKADPRALYEGPVCPHCATPFDPQNTPVLAKEWLVLPGEYIEDPHWWGCGRHRRAHYIPHALAQTNKVCILTHCPRTGRRLSQRRTVLWRRRNVAE